MSGGLHTLGMINSLKNNETIRRRNFKKTKKDLVKIYQKQNLNYKTSTKQDLDEIRKILIAERKRENIKWIFAILISLFIILMIFLNLKGGFNINYFIYLIQ